MVQLPKSESGTMCLWPRREGFRMAQPWISLGQGSRHGSCATYVQPWCMRGGMNLEMSFKWCNYERESSQKGQKALQWAPKTMKNKDFGYLKTKLFTIKTSKNVGFGGPWLIVNLSERSWNASHLDSTTLISAVRSFTAGALRQRFDSWAVRGKGIARCAAMSFGRQSCWRNLQTLGRYIEKLVWNRGCRFVPSTFSETIRHRWYQKGSKYWWFTRVWRLDSGTNLQPWKLIMKCWYSKSWMPNAVRCPYS